MMKIGLDYLLLGMLLITFFYCLMIDRRLRAFRSQEGSLRKVVEELATATENARDATSQLRLSLDEAQRSHWDHIEAAQSVHAKLGDRIDVAETLVARLSRGKIPDDRNMARSATKTPDSGVSATERKEALPSVQELARNLRIRTGTGLR